MTDGGADDDRVRVWLVERDYNDKGLVTLSYATPDGDREWSVSKAAAALSQTTVTAAREVDPESLSPVESTDRRERYRTEARRMADRHDPDEAV
jgi:hypothetical protein